MLSFCGIDVSKDRLDVRVLPEEQWAGSATGDEGFYRVNTRFDIATIHYISVPCSHQKPISISRYIVVAAVKFSRACSGSPARR